MEPQTSIKLVTTAEELKALVQGGYLGLANVLLTSDVVDYILTLSRNQRRPIPSAIEGYVYAFTNYGYECIQLLHISNTGSFADGQHRLFALQKIYKSNPDFKAPWQLVMFGISDDRAKDLDNGSPRRTRDVLRMADKCREALIASALSTWTRLIRKGMTQRKILARELEDAWDNGFKDVQDIGCFPPIKNITLLNCHSYRPPAWVVVCFYITLVTYGLDVAKSAYDQFYNGTDSKEPMVKFREWLVTNRGSIARPNVCSTEIVARVYGYFFYCIKRYVNGDDVDRVRSAKLGVTICNREF